MMPGFSGFADGGEGAASSKLLDMKRKLDHLMVTMGVVLAVCTGLVIGTIILAVQLHDNCSPVEKPAYLSFSASDGSTYHGSIYAGSGAWVSRTPLPVATSSLSGASVGSSVLLMGGVSTFPNSTKVVTDTVWVYDTTADVFQAGPSLPMPSTQGSAAADPSSSAVYYVAGRGTDRSVIASDCVFSLRAGANRWERMPCMSTPRSDFCSAFLDGKLYVIGGIDDASERILDTIEVFDPATRAWTVSAVKLPVGRADLQCAVLGHKVHVVGGVTKFAANVGPKLSYDGSEFTSVHLAIDFAAGTVVEVAPALYARADAALVPVKSKHGHSMIYMGGETFARSALVTDAQIGTHEVSQYYQALDVWVRKAPMLHSRLRFAAAAVEDGSGEIAVVSFGGHTACHDVNAEDSSCDNMESVEMFKDMDLRPVFIQEA